MAEYDLHDMEQAKRRVMEMQRRSQGYTGGRGSAQPPKRQPSPPLPPEPEPPCASPEPAEKKPTRSVSPAGLLNFESLDSDRTLILLLLLLLWGEKADRWLMLALLYCAL